MRELARIIYLSKDCKLKWITRRIEKKFWKLHFIDKYVDARLGVCCDFVRLAFNPMTSVCGFSWIGTLDSASRCVHFSRLVVSELWKKSLDMIEVRMMIVGWVKELNGVLSWPLIWSIRPRWGLLMVSSVRDDIGQSQNH